MKPEDFDLIRKILRERSGLVLGEEKAYLLESRLVPVARKHGLAGLDEIVQKVRTAPAENLLVDITEAMTTNESFFFRDVKPFDLFRDNILKDLIESRAAKKSFRIWCAAASSGQESYSLAILLKEAAAKLAGWRTEIVGTDISKEILARATEGKYSQFEVQRGLAIQLLVKYFTKEGEQWRISQDLRDMVSFREFNLLNDFTPLGKFDVVFCRNVLIYFDQETKKKVLERIALMLPPDGVVFLGGAETVLGITDKFEPVPGQRGIYKLTGK
ncbi:MAG: protein-glutamate O-methyltransferase [Rhodospirillales bacterium]|nr:protein-glutamate O-methyltransferase [Rhodospirillales bacterium]